MRNGGIAAACAVVAAFDALYVWIVVPLCGAVASSLPLAAQSIRDLPLVVDAVGSYVSSSLLSGAFAPGALVGPGTLPAWAAFVAVNALFAYQAANPGPPANPILDALPPAAGSNEYGSAVFLRSMRQLRNEARFTSRRATDLEHSKGGIYLGMMGRRVFLTTEDEHCLVLAPTRAGKTRRVILPMIAALSLSDESIIMFDPKGELFGLSCELFERRGYRINRIDFASPAHGNRWNPLSRAIDAYDGVRGLASRVDELAASVGAASPPEDHRRLYDLRCELESKIQLAEREVDAVVETMLPRDRQREGNSAFFNDGAESTLKMVLHYLVSSPACPKERKTLPTANALLADFAAPLPLNPQNPSSTTFVPLAEEIYKLDRNHPAYRHMKAVENAEPNYRRSFIQTAAGVLSAFSSSEMGDMMADTDIPIDELADEKTATFIIVPDEPEIYHQFAQLYIDQMYKLLTMKAGDNGNRLPHRMNMIAEELGQLPTIYKLNSRLSISAGRGIRWVLVLQDLSQVNDVYGKDKTPTIVNNCAFQIMLETSDTERTARYFSEKLGDYTIELASASASKAPLSMLGADRLTSSESLGRRRLLYPAEVEQWRVEYGAVVCRRASQAAIVPVPDVSQTPFAAMLGLGDRDHDRAKIERNKNRKVHERPVMSPPWSPDLKPGRYYSDEEAKRARARYLRAAAEKAKARMGAGTQKKAAKPDGGERRERKGGRRAEPESSLY